MPDLLPDLLRDTARRDPDRAAVSANGRTWRFGEVDALADALAATLRRLVHGGRRVGVMLPNHAAFPAILHGVLRSGSSAVMLNPLYSPRETEEAIVDAEVDAVLTVRPLAALLPARARALLVDALPGVIVELQGGAERQVPLVHERFEFIGSAHDEAVVVFTAATGGRARGARLSHANLLANARSAVEAMLLTADDRVAGVLPYVHLFGQTVTMNAPIAAGAAIVPVERFNPLRLLETIEAEGVTVICGVPGIFAALVAAAERRGTPTGTLRVAICGGAPLPLEVGRRWEELFAVPLREGYGLTEAGPVCLFNRVGRPNRPGTIGEPFPAVEASVRGPAGAELEHGEVGELCVRGPNVFLGYIGDDGRNPRDFHGEWLRTGDLASRDPDGAFRYRGLIKPMFTRNGFNVYPAEVARALEADPRIDRVIVAALPDAAKENEVVIEVVPARDAVLGEEDVREVCRARLAAFKQPARISIASRGDQPH
jgi:long-chain acyl-CoA synthetase